MFLISKLKSWFSRNSSPEKGGDIEMNANQLGTKYESKCSPNANGLEHFEQHHAQDERPKEEADFETAISAAGFGKFNVLLMLATMPGIMSSVFDTTVVSYILTSASCELELSSLDQGVLSGIIYGGMTLSAFVWGPMSDYFGRRNLMIVLFTCDGVCSICASIAPTFWVLAMFKFLGGFIISGPGAALIAFVAEYHSARYRSPALMVTGIYTSFGFSVIPLLAWYFIPQTWSTTIFFGRLNYSPWRLFVTVAALPSLVAAVVLCFFDETPKFLLAVGKKDEALRVLRRVYRINTGRDVSTYPVLALADEAKEVEDEVVSGVLHCEMHSVARSSLQLYFNQIRPIFSYPNVLKAMLICCLQFTGLLAVNMIRLWLPEMFASMQEFSLDADSNAGSNAGSNVGWSNLELPVTTICDMLGSLSQHSDTSSLVTLNATSGMEPCSMGAMQSATYVNAVIVGCTATVGYVLGSCIIGIIGKRQLIMGGFLVCGLCCTLSLTATEPNITVAFFAVFIAIGGVSNLAIISAIVDVFPTNLCAMAVSLSLMCGRLGSLIGSTIFPLLVQVSCELPFYLVGGMCALTCLLSVLLPGEKKLAKKTTPGIERAA